jgi:hypothetical protein
MTTNKISTLNLSLLWIASSLAVMAATIAPAQTISTSPMNLRATPADDYAAREAKGKFRHGWIANTPAAAAQRGIALTTRSGTSSAKLAATSNKAAPRYPADLTYTGGALVTTAQSHAIYMISDNPTGFDCNVIATCWGDPEGFLRDLGRSEFIHVTDQYVGTVANNRYTVGTGAKVQYAQVFTLTDNDILAAVHATALVTGQTGYAHIYHVFLPPFQNFPNSDIFCAYHASADFADLGHVLYTVEPSQAVATGCQVAPGSINGSLVDSTNNLLSHEMFETITDPDGFSWYNTSSLPLFELEIGDVCNFVTPNLFDVPTFRIGNKSYAVQSEYDNSKHACVTKP